MPVGRKQHFFDQVFVPAGGKRAWRLRDHQVLPQEKTWPGTNDEAAIHQCREQNNPGAIFHRTGLIPRDHEPVQDREKDRPLQIKLKFSFIQQFSDGVLNARFPPQSIKNQNRADAPGVSGNIAFTGKNHHGAFRKPGKGPNQSFDPVLFLKPVHPANGGNHLLPDLAFFLMVFNDLQVLMLS